jgi:hypothetical protein
MPDAPAAATLAKANARNLERMTKLPVGNAQKSKGECPDGTGRLGITSGAVVFGDHRHAPLPSHHRRRRGPTRIPSDPGKKTRLVADLHRFLTQIVEREQLPLVPVLRAGMPSSTLGVVRAA